jgi:transposase
MVPLLKRHEIQVLLGAGHKKKETAKLAGVPERTVWRIAREPHVVDVNDAAERKARGIGRPSVVESFRNAVVEILKTEPEVQSLEVLRRVRLLGYTGGKTALYGLVSSVRPKPAEILTRFEGLPGEFSQHDFGHVDVRFIDGRVKRVHFFASRLKYSRWVEVSLVPNETAETLVRNLVSHFAAMGGVPLVAVFDRPRTVALRWAKNGDVTEWNPTFAHVTLELGLGVEVCWPYSPQQKGSVENLVGWVKGSFFKQRRFLDDADLQSQLGDWLHEANTVRPSRATGVTPLERLNDERPRLRPLKVRPENLAMRVPVSVGPTARVLFETNTYAMPPESIGMPATAYVYRDRLKIVAGRHVREHPRLTGRNGHSTTPEDRAANVAAVSGKRGKRYLKRQDLLETGPAALHFLTELTHRRPRCWNDEIDQLHALLQMHGRERLNLAFQAALVRSTYGAEYVAGFLADDFQLTLFPEGEPLEPE